MNTKHSPLPWHIGMKPGPMIYGEQGEQIADMRNPLLFDEENTLNAQLILSCVNSHASLVSALKGILDYAENEAAALDNLKDSPEAEQEALSAIKACEAARAALEGVRA